jgi:hypothetical protein
MCNLTTQQTSNMTKEKDMIKERNTKDALHWKLNSKNVFLTVLHVLFLGVSLAVHPLVETGTVRALP